MCFWNFLKSLYFGRKGSFSTFFRACFCTSLIMLVLGTSNSEYKFNMWELKNVFLDFLKKVTILVQKGLFRLF